MSGRTLRWGVTVPTDLIAAVGFRSRAGSG